MTHVQTDTPIFPPGHPDAPPPPVEKPPPGMTAIWTSEGRRVVGYREQEFEYPRENAPPPQQRDPWPLRMAAAGGSIAAILTAIGYAGPGLLQAGHALEMAGIGVGVATGGLMLLKGSLGRQAGQQVNVSVNVSNSVSARASARSGRRR